MARRREPGRRRSRRGERYAEVLDRFQRERGTDIQRVQAVVLMRVDHAAPLLWPVYDTGATEAEVTKRWRDHHLGLTEGKD